MHYEKLQDGTVKCIEDEIPFEVPEGWAWCKLNDIYNFIDYRGATPTKITNGIPLVTAKNVKSGYIDYTIDDYISEEEFKERQQRGISKKGDILFTTEAPLGNAALADMEKFSAGQRLITFQQYGSKNELINYVMLMFILSDFFQQQLYVNKTGSTVAGIKAAILKTLWIPVPPYNEQLRISNTLKSAINLIDSISKNKEILSTSISNTKSKILDLAIRGKIVPQDPNDEPASVLLERIRAEKEELIKQGKIKRDKKESVIFKGDDNSYYEEYGEKLPSGWVVTNFETILEYEQPTKYIVHDTNYKPTYKTPVLTAGKSFILGYTNETDNIFDDLPVIIFDDFTTESKFVDFSFKVKSSAMKILHINQDLVLPKYAFYLMQATEIDHDNHQRYWISTYSQEIVALPPINEQERILTALEHYFNLLDTLQ